jgi:hypothetical protein
LDGRYSYSEEKLIELSVNGAPILTDVVPIMFHSLHF